MVAVFVGVVLYNVAVGMLSGGDATISVRLQHHARNYPIIAGLAFGILSHIFWPVRGIKE